MLFDIKFDHLTAIVQYLYNGETQVPANEIDDFFRVANKLQILGLCKTASDEQSESSFAENAALNFSSSVVFNVDSGEKENDEVVEPRPTPNRKTNRSKSKSVKHSVNLSNESNGTTHGQKRARSKSSMNGNENGGTSAKGSGEVASTSRLSNENGEN